MRPLNLGACLLGMPSVLHAASPRSTKPLFTARRLPRDAEKHAFRAFAGGRISQKKIKAPFESVVDSTGNLGVGSTRLHPSSSSAELQPNLTPPCKTGCLAPAVAAITAKLQTTLQKATPSPRARCHQESHGLDA